jgi:hypothetical protein
MVEENGRQVPGELALMPPAEVAFDQWRARVRTLEDGAGGLLKSWLGKMPGAALRMALLLRMLRWCGDKMVEALPPVMIERRDMEAAVRFLESYALPMARRCFGAAAMARHERDATTLARWLAARSPLPAVLNVRDLRRMADGPAIGDGDRIREALDVLAEAGWVRRAPAREGTRKGRQRDDWQVSPHLAAALTAVAARRSA